MPSKPTNSRKGQPTKSSSNPNNLIAIEISEFAQKAIRPYTRDELIQSYVNGTSKGFINGLKVALQLIGDHLVNESPARIYDRLQMFIEQSEEAQSGKSQD